MRCSEFGVGAPKKCMEHERCAHDMHGRYQASKVAAESGRDCFFGDRLDDFVLLCTRHFRKIAGPST